MKDGHIHSPYCPHGSKDALEDYVKRAIEIGLDEITFTEHLPLPENFKDPSPENDSAMSIDQLHKYMEEVRNLKYKYKDKIKINLGVEVDYLEGYEEETRKLLDKYGMYFDDSILSVHILNFNGEYYVIDYSKEEFENIYNLMGGVSDVYYKYYKTLKKAVRTDLGEYKPKRIGHLNLVRKFNRVFPYNYDNNIVLEELLMLIKEKGYELDYNVSGLLKEYCKEPYISGHLLELVKKYKIPVVFGSDAHSVENMTNYDIDEYK
ncbi:MAG: histidinol-phosphatase HisJ [Peptostreptococcaceae bacterium]|nr:histidinol-phosphatase HisJ [Peptostreptococcaceae bacterium]